MVSEALSPQCHWGSPLCSFVPWQSSRKQIPPPESSDPRLDAATLCCSVPLGHCQFHCTDLARPLCHHVPALGVPDRDREGLASTSPQKYPRGDPGATKQTRYPTLLSRLQALEATQSSDLQLPTRLGKMKHGMCSHLHACHSRTMPPGLTSHLSDQQHSPALTLPSPQQQRLGSGCQHAAQRWTPQRALAAQVGSKQLWPLTSCWRPGEYQSCPLSSKGCAGRLSSACLAPPPSQSREHLWPSWSQSPAPSEPEEQSSPRSAWRCLGSVPVLLG